MKLHIFNLILIVSLSLSLLAKAERSRVHNSSSYSTPQSTRRILHQPLFPVTSSNPPSSGDDDSLPPPPPAESSGDSSDQPFFPEVPGGSNPNPNPNPTPPPPLPAQPTNGSPQIPAATQPSKPTKKVAIAISVGIVTLGMLSGLAFYLYKHRAKQPAETQKLVSAERNSRYGGRGGDEESNSRVPPSSFLYIGTVEPSNQRSTVTVSADNNNTAANGSPFHKLNSDKRSSLERYRPSPDLQPLPPLSKAPPMRKARRSSPPAASLSSSDEESRDTMFYTPHGSVASIDEGFWTSANSRSTSSRTNGSSLSNSGSKGEIHGSNSFPHSKRTSSRSRRFDSSPDVVKHAIIPSIKTTPNPPPQEEEELELTNAREYQTQDMQEMRLSLPKRAKFAPPPPPPNLALLRTLTGSPSHQKSKPPARSPPPPPPAPPPRPPPPPSRPLQLTPKKVRSRGTNGSPQVPPKSQLRSPNSRESPRKEKAKPDEEIENGCNYSGRSNGDDMDERRPRLKPLHWDKVRATSDRETVWDQLQSSSFQLNEDMMESLFGCNSSTSVKKEAARKSVIPPVQKEIRVLDPKKSQNIAILLRALNVTKDEVADALLDGNPEGMGADLLETLVKMAPTKEEEIKLKDYNRDISKLGSAERFLKGILDIPFAFKRVEAMLYRANFDGEVKYLRTSFETLEIASEELKNSRLFLKLLEAVLQAGNRMNVGTNRGEAKAFKLDTLLKLADVKGTDGKTTLLHFVVQEILRSEGMGSDSMAQTLPNQLNSDMKDEEFRKQGLQVLSGLSKELASVKTVAGMDSDVLSSYVTKLEMGLEKVRAVLQYEKPEMQGRFFELMKKFLREAEQEIARVKAHERKALAHVREVTQYFHGDTSKEEAHPFRVFLIVRDFLLVLDNVCKEVGKIEERTMMGTARSFRISAYASLPVLTKYKIPRDYSSGEDGMSS